MMDDKNKRLEEFFNRSLEEFNDGPSEQVWEGLTERLEEDMTFIQRWRNQIVQWLPALLLLIGFGAYFLFTQNKINLLEEELQSANLNNTSLNITLNECNSNRNDVENKYQSAQEYISALQSEAKQINPNASETGLPDGSSFSQNSPSTKPGHPFSTTNNFTPKKYSAGINNFTPAIFTKELNQLKNKNTSQKESPTRNVASRQAFQPLEKLSRHRSRIVPYFGNSRNSHGMSYIYIPPNDQLQFSKESRYRFGFNARSVSTLMSGIGNSFNIGFSKGFRQEYQISKKWSLTNHISFVNHHYELSNNGGLLPISTLKRFPGAENLNDIINSIKVESSYLDLALGLKWTSWQGKNGSTYFVNPSVVWQAYFPQEYKYGIIGGSSIQRKEKRFFGYFGSGNLHLGMERQFKERMIWQIGVWAERSFIPLGLEDQDITLAGLSTSLLFGKRR